MNVLFVCTANKMRSLTAETVFKEDPRFEVKSAGTADDATRTISLELLTWADYILVMEKKHRNQIRKLFPNIYKNKRIICLYIPDEYDYMEPSLIGELKTKFEGVWEKEISPES